MKNLLVIFAALFVFALAGCVKNAKVNLPIASKTERLMAKEVADFVIKYGVDDPDCKMLQKCRKVTYNFESSGSASIIVNVELGVKEKFGKRTLEINDRYEEMFNFVDKRADGSIDYLKSVNKGDGSFLESTVYKDGIVSVVYGIEVVHFTKPPTPQDIQMIYSHTLEKLTEKIRKDLK